MLTTNQWQALEKWCEKMHTYAQVKNVMDQFETEADWYAVALYDDESTVFNLIIPHEEETEKFYNEHETITYELGKIVISDERDGEEWHRDVKPEIPEELKQALIVEWLGLSESVVDIDQLLRYFRSLKLYQQCVEFVDVILKLPLIDEIYFEIDGQYNDEGGTNYRIESYHIDDHVNESDEEGLIYEYYRYQIDVQHLEGGGYTWRRHNKPQLDSVLRLALLRSLI